MRFGSALHLLLVLACVALGFKKVNNNAKDITLYIDEKQIKELSSFPMEIFAISDGIVLPYLLDPNFENYLPVIPSDVSHVNFTWRSGDRKYFYEFDELKSFNETLLHHPVLSIQREGKVPRKAKIFQVLFTCRGNKSGIANFAIGLRIQTERGSLLSGTPIRLHLRKACADHGPDPECDKKCSNGGKCNKQKICECPKGYMGKYCKNALCYPQCMNGGTCISPGLCLCVDGYQGPMCEGGICLEKCLNGGKCYQKDRCACSKGYYGRRCEYSKCNNVCLNNGRCVGVNRCRCVSNFTGNNCFVERPKIPKNEGCKKKCVHGICHQKQCSCDKGWYGKRCTRRKPRQRHQRKTYH